MAFKTNGNTAKAKETPSFSLIEECGKIADRKGGYELKLRFGSWNDNEPKYDIRAWKINDEGEEISSKGITLTGEELESLYNILKVIAEDEPAPTPKKGKKGAA